MRRSIWMLLAAMLVPVQSAALSVLPCAAQGDVNAIADAQQTTGTWDQPPLRGAAPAGSSQPAVAAPAESSAPAKAPVVVQKRIRKDWWTAYRMAADPWLYKEAASDPSILAAICAYPWAAKRLAANPHLGMLAECDHYLCRRLTRWYSSTWVLVQAPEADRVIALDPEGIFMAIERDPGVAHALARNAMFNQMITENPDLGRFIAQHM